MFYVLGKLIDEHAVLAQCTLRSTCWVRLLFCGSTKKGPIDLLDRYINYSRYSTTPLLLYFDEGGRKLLRNAIVYNLILK